MKELKLCERKAKDVLDLVDLIDDVENFDTKKNTLLMAIMISQSAKACKKFPRLHWNLRAKKILKKYSLKQLNEMVSRIQKLEGSETSKKKAENESGVPQVKG